MNWNSNLSKIAIHSVPRSGSTWLGSIFDSNPNVCFRFQPLFSYRYKGYLSESSDYEEIQLFFKEILNTKDEFVLQKEAIKKGLVPHFKKRETTHVIYKEVRYHHILNNLLEKDEELKLIGLIRNPFAVINSWLTAPKEFRQDLGWDELSEWRYAKKKNLDKIEEFNGYEKWKEVLYLFTDLKAKYSNRVYILHYDDLINDAKNKVKELHYFCGLNFDDQTDKYIASNQSSKYLLDAYSVFRKKQDDDNWKTQLNPKIIKEIRNDLLKSNLSFYIDE